MKDQPKCTCQYEKGNDHSPVCPLYVEPTYDWDKQKCPKCDNRHPAGIECPVALGFEAVPIGKPKPIQPQCCEHCWQQETLQNGVETAGCVIPMCSCHKSQEEKTEEWKEWIAEVLRNRIKFIGENEQIYTGFPQQLLEELYQAIRTLLQKEREKTIGQCSEIVNIFWDEVWNPRRDECIKKLYELLK